MDDSEFFTALLMLCQAPLARKAEMVFRIHDFDGNLFVCKDELVILLMSLFGAIAQYCS